MTYTAQDFDLLNHWARLSEAELLAMATDEALDVLRRLAAALSAETETNLKQANFVANVRHLHELYRRGSRGLGEAIINASSYEREGKPAEARKIYEEFISSCPSDFYKRIAKHHLDRIRSSET